MTGDRDELIKAVDLIKAAFGAPGDYGYGTPKGDALFALYRAAAGKASDDDIVEMTSREAALGPGGSKR